MIRKWLGKRRKARFQRDLDRHNAAQEKLLDATVNKILTESLRSEAQHAEDRAWDNWARGGPWPR